MDVAEWIIVAILSLTLFVFLVLGIIFLVKLLGLSDDMKTLMGEARIILRTGQRISKKTEGVVDNVKDFTSVGTIAKDTALSAVEKLVEKGVAKEEVVKKHKTDKTAKS
ncbi:hypothetical protein IJI72_03290 [Candidatus Saccharibacteria bacterium]|nr:hypothetical protein [Candidatus Saccharibacteria bacterium]